MKEKTVINLAAAHLIAAVEMGQEQVLANALLATHEQGENKPLWIVAANIWLGNERVREAYQVGLMAELNPDLPARSEVEKWEALE